MPIPNYQELMLPLLQVASKHSEISMTDAIDHLALAFNLTNEERSQLLPSSVQRLFNNRVGWARTYLKEAGLISSPRRGFISITTEGQNTISISPKKIDRDYLLRFPNFIDFLNRKSVLEGNNSIPVLLNDVNRISLLSESPPEELIANAHMSHKETIKVLLLERLLESSFSFFEKVVVDIMLKLGYGGGRQDAGMVLGKTGDEGIDGVINQDRLGLEMIYLQAKRWQVNQSVSRPDIQKFAGALVGKARKGVLITTSSFSREARAYAEKLCEYRIILIDGKQLCELMWETNLGLTPIDKFELKRFDGDYFDEST